MTNIYQNEKLQKKRDSSLNDEDWKDAVHAVKQMIMNQSKDSAAFNIPRATIQIHLGNTEKKIGPDRSIDLPVKAEETITKTTKAVAR